LVLVAPPVLAYQLLVSDSARPSGRAWSAFIGTAAAVAAPWYVAMAWHEPGYLHHFFWKANLLRFANAYDHQQPWWLYFPVLFGIPFPWSLLWPALLFFLFNRTSVVARWRSPGLGFSLLSLVWCVAFFSFAGCKSPPYMAPALAPLAVLLGACLDGCLF